MKKSLILIFLLLGLILISGGCSQTLVCEQPYIQVGNDCCLDQDGNSICDKDEQTVKTTTESIGDKEGAEKVATDFAKTWEREDYASLYDYFTPELKSQKTKDEFIRVLTNSELSGNSIVVRLDDLKVTDSETALAYFHIEGYSIFKEELPSFEMKLINGEWKFDAFAGFFGANCVFNYDCSYKRECKKEFESKDISQFYYNLCENSECICKGGEFVTFKDMCGTNYGDDEQQKDNEIRCKYVAESQNKIEMKYIPIDDKTFKIKNLETKSLSDVVIRINGDYVIDKGVMGAQEEYLVEKAKLVSETGKKMSEFTPVNSIYVYSYEGKWLYGISWDYLGKPI